VRQYPVLAAGRAVLSPLIYHLERREGVSPVMDEKWHYYKLQTCQVMFSLSHITICMLARNEQAWRL